MTPDLHPTPRWGRPLAAALAGLFAGAAMLVLWPSVWPHISSDLDAVILGARSLWRGTDPYRDSWEWTSPGWPWPLTYPAPALIAALPLAPLPMVMGRAVFVALSVSFLALALTREKWWPMLLLCSGSVVHAVTVAQWGPLLTAGSLLPGMGWVLACKPNLGLSLWLGSRDWLTARRIALQVAAAAIVGTIVLPGWIRGFADGVGHSPHISLLLRPFGWVLLLALLCWRDPAARLVLALAAVPQAASFADSVPLLLVARTRGEAIVMTGASLAGYVLWSVSATPRGTYEAIVAHGWPFVLVGGYLPALCVVLRRGWAARSARRGPARDADQQGRGGVAMPELPPA